MMLLNESVSLIAPRMHWLNRHLNNRNNNKVGIKALHVYMHQLPTPSTHANMYTYAHIHALFFNKDFFSKCDQILRKLRFGHIYRRSI